MSEAESQDVHSEAEAGPVTDLYLDILLSVLNADESNSSHVGVTLMVGGSLITGDLISLDQWEQATRETLAKAGPGAAPLVHMIDRIRETAPSSENEFTPVNFVHLKDAQFVTNHLGTVNGIQPMSIERGLWRGRLSDVQGWSLGRSV